MVDITMSLDDTLELDTIIKESNIATDPITDAKHRDDNTNHITDFNGFQTHTGVFSPPKSGVYDIKINDQTLSIKVTDPSTIPNTQKNHWKLDSGSGSTVLDTEGTQDGSINGASWTTDSKTGNYALSFKSGDEVTLYDFDTDQSFTFTAWIKVRNYDTGSYNAGSVFYTQKYGLRVDSGGSIGFSYYDGSSNNTGINTTGYNTDTWYLIAGGIDASKDEISVWVNETKKNSKTVNGEANLNGNTFRLGYNVNDDLPFDGIIDDPRIFLEEPNQDLISSVYNSTV